MNRHTRTRLLQQEGCVVEVDSHHNRVYVRLGELPNEPADPAGILEALHELKHYVTPGFTMLVEGCRQGILAPEKNELVEDILDLLYEGGLDKIAELCSVPGHFRRSQQLGPGPQDTTIRHSVFMEYEDAVRWLDVC